MNNNLIYTLVNFNNKYYISMFQIFLKSMILFSKLTFDLLIITDQKTQNIIASLKELQQFSKVHFIILQDDIDLYHALLRKCDIVLFKDFLKYTKIMYLDCDIIIQKDINILFNIIKAKPNILYAPAEGTLDGDYWKLNAYTSSDYVYLKKNGIKSFNSGTFIFIPSLIMKKHFINVKNMALSYKGEHYYDQSFLNYYFNINNSSSTKYITNNIVLFPNPTKYYPSKTLLHFAGLGKYKEKVAIMKKYLDMLILIKVK